MNHQRRERRSAAKPRPKELNHGFHGLHGWEIDSERTTFIRAIRAIRGKISAKRRDPYGLEYKTT
jgi:hypothetical protein